MFNQFYCKKLIIPSDRSGYHPYLNVVALLYDGENNSPIYEWWDSIKTIHKYGAK